MFGYKNDPLLFTKTQANRFLHTLIEEEWWKDKDRAMFGIPNRRYSLEEFHIEQVHNKYSKISRPYRRVIPHKAWIEIQNEYDAYKALFLSKAYPNSAYDWKQDKYFVKDYIERTRAAV